MMSGGCGSWIGFGSGVEVAQPVVLAFERMRSVRPGPEDDLELLFEHVHPRSGVGERKAVRSVLVLVPASAESELNPSAGALVGAVVTSLASVEGWRNVAGETIVPSRSVEVTAASALSVPHASSDPRSGCMLSR